YTLLFSNASSVSLNAALHDDLRYDTVKDFRPIVQLSNGGVLIIVDPSLHVKNLKEFVAYVREHPGMSYATWGVGSTGHLNMEALIDEYNLKMQHVPYRAMGQITTDMLGGQIKIASVDARSPVALIEAGKVVPVAMTGSRRGPLLPDVPTLAEQGFDFQLDGWYGIFAPAGTPESIVKLIHDKSLEIRMAPDLQKTFHDINLPPPPQKTSDAFADTIREEIAIWQRVVSKAGLKEK
ncbi:MAG: Bug family tripartite tricarboxylate transporter substrate binding protein, partial [Sphingobacterium sp.]